MGKRAIGVYRVSERGDRDGASFTSPQTQRQGMRDLCARRGYELVEMLDEVDVSGGLPLERRRGMWPAVQAVEGRRAEVLLVHAFDRLVRNLGVQREIVDRVEAAGGIVLAGDFGEVSHKTAIKRLTSSLLGAVHEYYRESVREKSAEGQRAAVARGAAPWPRVPPGYLRGADGVLVPDPATRGAVAEAFVMRAGGATVGAVREHLRAHGVDVSYAAVSRLLASRAVLGEVYFGELVNRAAHPAIVDPAVWRAAQRVRVPAGRLSKSDRLLARLGVLRCGSCDRRMSASTAHHGTTTIYRCSAHAGDPCPRQVTISAPLVEGLVVDRVKGALRDVRGAASALAEARAADVALEHAQAEFDAAIRAFTGLEDEAAARERLAELRAARDRAQRRADDLRGTRTALTVTADDWDRLTLDERRALVRAVVARVVVVPGRGAGRVTIELLGQ